MDIYIIHTYIYIHFIFIHVCDGDKLNFEAVNMLRAPA